MKPPGIPPDEPARLQSLKDLQILDTPPEPAFDALTRLAAHIAQVPIALVSLVDADRQWFKSRYGLEAPQTSREVSFCGHVVAARARLIVADSFSDERFSDNPLATGEPHVRFYAGLPLRTPEGHVLGTLCAIDHQARHLAPEQLEMLGLLAQQVVDQLELRRQALKLLSRGQFFEMALSLFCTADASLRFRELNPAWERTLGWTREELRARPFTEFLHLEDQASTIDTCRRLLSGEVALDFENRWRHRDGRWIPLRWNATARAGTFYAAAVDLSERTSQEARLRESEARFRAIFESSVDPVTTIDERGNIDQVNPAVEKTFGYAPAELVGRNVSVLMPSPFREQHDGYLARYLESGQRKVIGVGREVVALRKDGTTFPAELSVSEFHLGSRRFFTGVLRDISDRKRVERLQAEFVSTVSHELRTPLTSIRGALGLVAGGVTGDLPKEAREYVEIALSNSERLVRLINDILDFEKMQSGTMEFRLSSLSLRAALASAVAANAAFASAHGARIVLVEPVPAGEVVADPDRLAQVLANLISNAVKFSPPGAPVEVGAAARGRTVRVTVRDRGPGIPEEFRSRIFQRFAQADASTTRAQGGTGLGLSISKSIVEKLRGTIGFEPATGSGTVFYFDLPLFPPPDVGAHPAPQPQVLVCEDDPDFSFLLEQLLSSSGYRVHVSPTVERARRLLAEHFYDAVTLDLRLADGDGTPVIDAMRSTDRHRHTPIVVVTGSVGAVGGLALAMADVLTKPIDESRLLASLEAAIAGRRRERPRLLHVEDDPDLRRIIRRTLPEAWQVQTAESLRAGREALSQGPFDLVLLDLGLPDGPGESLLGLVGRTPVVIFSAREAPAALAQRVAGAMVKSRATPAEIRETILALLPGGKLPADRTD